MPEFPQEVNNVMVMSNSSSMDQPFSSENKEILLEEDFEAESVVSLSDLFGGAAVHKVNVKPVIPESDIRFACGNLIPPLSTSQPSGLKFTPYDMDVGEITETNDCVQPKLEKSATVDVQDVNVECLFEPAEEHELEVVKWKASYQTCCDVEWLVCDLFEVRGELLSTAEIEVNCDLFYSVVEVRGDAVLVNSEVKKEVLGSMGDSKVNLLGISGSDTNRPQYVKLQIEAKPMVMEVDCGASYSLIHESEVKTKFPAKTVLATSIQLKSVSGPMEVVGQINVEVKTLDGECLLLPLMVSGGPVSSPYWAGIGWIFWCQDGAVCQTK